MYCRCLPKSVLLWQRQCSMLQCIHEASPKMFTWHMQSECTSTPSAQYIRCQRMQDPPEIRLGVDQKFSLLLRWSYLMELYIFESRVIPTLTSTAERVCLHFVTVDVVIKAQLHFVRHSKRKLLHTQTANVEVLTKSFDHGQCSVHPSKYLW